MTQDFPSQDERVNTEDPKSPHYQWESDAKLEISGGEFEWVMHVLNTYLNQPKAQEVLAMAQARTMCEQVMRRGIEAGVIVDKNK